MLKNRRLARHLAGVGMGELRRQLGYKTGWRGGRLVVADRWYPSSKTCLLTGLTHDTPCQLPDRSGSTGSTRLHGIAV
jgi:transposase